MSFALRLCLPLRRITLVHALRNSHPVLTVLSRSYLTPTAPPHTPRHASFSTTPQRRASEDPELQHLVEQQQKMLRLLQEKPELVQVVQEFAEKLQAEGASLIKYSFYWFSSIANFLIC